MILLDNSDFPWQHPSFGILYKPEREGWGLGGGALPLAR